MKRERILEKIKGLLKKSRESTNPVESVIAARMVRKLMDRYQIKESDIKEESAFGSKCTDEAFKRRQKWQDWLCIAVAEWNDCQTVNNWKDGYCRHEFRGFLTDAIVAKYMFEFLRDEIIRLCKLKNYRNRRLTFQYKNAACDAVRQKIREEITERKKHFVDSAGTSLVVIKSKLVDAHYGEMKYKTDGPTRKPSTDEINAYKDGLKDGRNINLSKHIQGSEYGVLT